MKQILTVSLQNLQHLGDVLKEMDRSGVLINGADLQVVLSENVEIDKARVDTFATDCEGTVTGDGEEYTIRRIKG